MKKHKISNQKIQFYVYIFSLSDLNSCSLQKYINISYHHVIIMRHNLSFIFIYYLCIYLYLP